MTHFYRISFHHSLIVMLTVGLSACGGVPIVDWENGARVGKVVDMIDPQAPVTDVRPCIAALLTKTLADKHFARVAIHGVRSVRVDIAEMPVGVPTTPGTAVEIYPSNCTDGKLGRVTRALPPQ